MDLFVYLPDFRVLVCRVCKYAVAPAHLRRHLTHQHRLDFPELREKGGCAEVARRLLSTPDQPLLDPAQEEIDWPTPGGDAIPALALHSGWKCEHCPKASTSRQAISRHFSADHLGSKRSRGRPKRTPEGSGPLRPDWHPAACQRFFATGRQSSFFAVVSPAQREEERQRAKETTASRARAERAAALSEAEFVTSEVLCELVSEEEHLEDAARIVQEDGAPTEVSTWLELTRWPAYLYGHRLSDVARLADLPDPELEPLLEALCDSLDRVVAEAHRSVCDDRINVFDQVRINSFLERPRAADRPLMVKLKRSTYRKYVAIGKRLLCFVHRTVQPDQALRLQHRFTPAQVACYDRTVACAKRLLGCGTNDRARAVQAEAALDAACLDFYVALLDHNLQGPLFESAAVGFLAVLGIDEEKGILKEAYHYTPTLSGFIKIAQLVVI